MNTINSTLLVILKKIQGNFRSIFFEKNFNLIMFSISNKKNSNRIIAKKGKKSISIDLHRYDV